MSARLAVATLLLSGCIVPLAIPSMRIDGGYGSTGQKTLRAGTHVVGYRIGRDASWDLGAGYAVTSSHEMTPGAQGAYLDTTYFQRVDDSSRLGIGPGIAAMFTGGQVVPTTYVRASFEMFAPTDTEVSAEDECGSSVGQVHGESAFGTYVDFQKPITEPGFSVVAGITLRLPAFMGIAVVIPYCK